MTSYWQRVPRSLWRAAFTHSGPSKRKTDALARARARCAPGRPFAPANGARARIASLGWTREEVCLQCDTQRFLVADLYRVGYRSGRPVTRGMETASSGAGLAYSAAGDPVAPAARAVREATAGDAPRPQRLDSRPFVEGVSKVGSSQWNKRFT